MLRRAGERRKKGESKHMWYLIEDFFEQSIVGKLFVGVGWLAMLIMAASFMALVVP